MKRCTACGREKPRPEFTKRADSPDGLKHECRACTARRNKAYKSNNNEKVLARAAQRRREIREYVMQVKSAPCTDCGRTYPPYVMEFDHLPGNGKAFNIGFMATRVGWAKIKAEIDKCEVVCANCHRIRTFQRQEGAATSDQDALSSSDASLLRQAALLG